ncbi:Rha family transcriptional regulator [uncultured Desulfovibrio sp.]|uniref:Rha family transcriptional regulator n=1 Tax=uncultured Desulfovibrio sp. TaxID=167968 RepID=UPI002637B441|nr:Rha family transcriptional regulator [uncultured Desulfovibrio sp.]
MAENSLSQAVSFINDNSTMEVGLTAEGQPAVRSDIVAYHFHRNHRDVLRDIRKLRAKCPESFYQRNFAPVEYTDSKGEKRPACLLTRDAFSLLVMGFTGAEAVRWKIRYIEAFNTLEAAALESRAELARESAYRRGYDEGRASALPDVQDAEKKARKEAAETMLALCPQRRETLKKALRYARMGLSCREITKLLDGNQRQIGHLLSLARKNGLLPPAKATPALRQGSLLEAGERA